MNDDDDSPPELRLMLLQKEVLDLFVGDVRDAELPSLARHFYECASKEQGTPLRRRNLDRCADFIKSVEEHERECRSCGMRQGLRPLISIVGLMNFRAATEVLVTFLVERGAEDEVSTVLTERDLGRPLQEAVRASLLRGLAKLPDEAKVDLTEPPVGVLPPAVYKKIRDGLAPWKSDRRDEVLADAYLAMAREVATLPLPADVPARTPDERVEDELTSTVRLVTSGAVAFGVRGRVAAHLHARGHDLAALLRYRAREVEAAEAEDDAPPKKKRAKSKKKKKKNPPRDQ